MIVLGIETATPHGGVALVGPGGLLAETTALLPMRHLEWLIPAVDRLLTDVSVARQAIEGIAVSRGPGGFTGLRIGIATATAWARSMGVPIVGLSTLEVLAAGIGGAGLIAAVVDARRGEAAMALFRREEDGTLIRMRDDAVVPVDGLAAAWGTDAPVTIVGDGVGRLTDAVRAAFPHGTPTPAVLWAPRAAVLATLGRERLVRGERDDPYRLYPVYGRRPYAEQVG